MISFHLEEQHLQEKEKKKEKENCKKLNNIVDNTGLRNITRNVGAT